MTSPSTDALMPLEAHPEAGGTAVSYKQWWSLRQELDRFEQDLKISGYSSKTIEDYRWALKNGYEALRKERMPVNPRSFGQEHIDFLKGVHWARCSHNTGVSNLSAFRSFIKWAKNKQVGQLRWPVRDGTRPGADWLSDEDAMRVRAEARGLEKIVVHLELDLLLRRVEVLRLKHTDFETGQLNVVHVRGKGRHGGKWRTLTWHEETSKVLESCERMRDELIGKARTKTPSFVVVPDELLIYELGGRLYSYKKSAMDNVVNRLGERLGLKFSHHTLRRTGARMMYFAGNPLEKVGEVLGHSDPRTTRLYLGLNSQDMAHTMELYAKYQKAVKIPGNGISASSQQNGGPCGI